MVGGRILLDAQPICLLKDDGVSETFPLDVLKCEVWKRDQQGPEQLANSTQTHRKRAIQAKLDYFAVYFIALTCGIRIYAKQFH